MRQTSLPKIIAFGDSITYGYPFGNKYSWVQFLSEKLSIPILNRGENGDNFRDLFRRVGPEVLDVKPDLVLFMAGTNDILEQSPLEFIEERYIKIMECLKQQLNDFIYIIPPAISETTLRKYQKQFYDFSKKYCKKHKIQFFSFFELFLDSKERALKIYYEDPVHPSLKGYQKMADHILPFLQKKILPQNKQKMSTA